MNLGGFKYNGMWFVLVLFNYVDVIKDYVEKWN